MFGVLNMRGNTIEEFIEVKGLEDADVNVIRCKALSSVRISGHHDDRHVGQALTSQFLDQGDTISTWHTEIAQYKLWSDFEGKC